MIRALETLLLMVVAAVLVLSLGHVGLALGWPVPATLALPGGLALLVGIITARLPLKGRRHG